MKIEPVMLRGEHVQLEPFDESHVAGLRTTVDDPAVWRYMPFTLDSEESIRGWLAVSRAWLEEGSGLGFAIRHRESGEIAGSSSYMAASAPHRRVEIGGTWLAPRWQRTGVNTEAKYLLLRHAFDTWGCNRVEFKTDARNRQSRDALARIGASEEGTLRRHMVLPDGALRDSVYFSVIREEWPDVARHLRELMARRGPREVH